MLNIGFLNRTVEFLEREWQQLGQIAQERLVLSRQCFSMYDLHGNRPTVWYAYCWLGITCMLVCMCNMLHLYLLYFHLIFYLENGSFTIITVLPSFINCSSPF